MHLTSFAFGDNSRIPVQYTCDGEDMSVPLSIDEVPEDAQSLVLIVDDPDAPSGTWDHWVMYNIPPETRVIDEGEEPEGERGNNSWGRLGWGGPCPPDGEHRYLFKLYALDTILDLPEGVSKTEVMEAMEGHVMEEALLMGRYDRQKGV